jgi:hypothetical protein
VAHSYHTRQAQWRKITAQILAPNRVRKVSKTPCAKKTARSFAGHLVLILAHFRPYSAMDVTKLAVQHARIACFTTQMLSTAATFLLTDNAEVRIKTSFHQRMRWKKFVLNYQN